jgi:hypothetical protein
VLVLDEHSFSQSLFMRQLVHLSCLLGLDGIAETHQGNLLDAERNSILL